MWNRGHGVAVVDKAHNRLVIAQVLRPIRPYLSPRARPHPTSQGPQARSIRTWRRNRLGARLREHSEIGNRLT